VRYRLRERLVELNYVSDIEIPPKIWNAIKQNVNSTKQVDSESKTGLDRLISDRKTLILTIYSTSQKEEIESEWLSIEIE
jgi:hypothetical protein